MSDQPIEQVRDAYDRLCLAAIANNSAQRCTSGPVHARDELHGRLEVIPSLKLTDKGLVDVEKFQIVDLFV